jgi:GTP-binding protein
VLDAVYSLYIDLGADEEQLEFPVLYAIARSGLSSRRLEEPGTDLTPLFDSILSHIPSPSGGSQSEPLQLLVDNLDYDDYVGRLAIGRVHAGKLSQGMLLSVVREGGLIQPGKVLKLYGFSGLKRIEVADAGPGEIVSIAGIDELSIGDTLADPATPRALPRITVDEPTMMMVFRVNDGPLAGREGKYVTSRNLRERLFRESYRNVSIRVFDTEAPDAFRVVGRGELQLAVIIETMRREGYELEVSRPEVVTRDIDGKRHEPLEEGMVDVPDEHVGTVTQTLAPRKGKVIDMRPGDPGRTVITFEAPARGLLGMRGEMLTATRGTALMHTRHRGWIPWVGELPTRKGGAMVSDRAGVTTAYVLDNLQLRGELLVGPGEAVYEGMIVGENARAGDMVVNAVREKQKTNIRTHAADDAVKLVPPRELTIETAIEFIADDELVEVTPRHLRVRKRLLREPDRRRSSKS